MSNRRVCITGVHVIQDGISYRMFFPTGRHILQDDRSYWCEYIIGSHALLKGMITSGHVLQEYMYYERALLLKVMF